jgi:hypothetical protein
MVAKIQARAATHEGGLNGLMADLLAPSLK